MVVRGGLGVTLLALMFAGAACGKKGPPLAPLHLVPMAPEGLAARRQADDVRLRFVVPAKNVNGPGRVDVERIEIYAVTVAPGGIVPPNRELMSKPYVVGAIDVRPAPIEGEAPPEGEKRPGPGDTVTFTEKLTPDKMKGATAPAPTLPVPAATAPATPAVPAGTAPATPAIPAGTAPAAPPVPAGTVPAATPVPAGAPVAPPPAAAAVPPPPQILRRIYVVRGVTRSGRPGAQSPRIEIPLAGLPPTPGGVAVRNTEKAIVVEWLPAVADPSAGIVAYNVYRADEGEPLNAAPLPAPGFEHAGASSDVEQCFQVRSVQMAGTVAVESEPSAAACLTPTDTFPPAAPKGLAAVPGPGVINLIWDANAEADLDGYIILRGEAPGDKLQPLTPAPVRATTFTDTTVKPNVRYVYAIAAVDNAKPPNRSAESERVSETAR